MFEVIALAVVCWIGYSVIKGFSRAKETVRSQEFGKEARHIATRELGVPEIYHNHLVGTRIDEVKEIALRLRERVPGLQFVSWPRLLAITVFLRFREDCAHWQHGGRAQQQLFERLDLSAETLMQQTRRDGLTLLEKATGVELNALVTDSITDEEIKQILVRRASTSQADRIFPRLTYGRVNDFIEAQKAGGEWFPNYTGVRTYLDIDGAEYYVYVETLNPDQKDASGVSFEVAKCEDTPTPGPQGPS